MSKTRDRLLRTDHGSHRENFTSFDWFLFTSASVAFGSAFLFTTVALEDVRPGLVTTIRAAVGAMALVCLRGSRTSIDREDFRSLLLLTLVWVVIPMTVVPIAQQWIDSAVAGMMSGAMPLAAAGLAAWLLAERPSTQLLVGMSFGFVGVVLISVPSLGEGVTGVLGVVLMMLAVLSYAVAVNVAVPLQQRYGSTAVMSRMLVLGAVATVPWAVISVPGSTLTMKSGIALLTLGLVGTSGAYVLMATLIGRVGATRSSFVAYLVPVVALALGVWVLDETVQPIALGGVVLVTLGAFLASRRDASRIRA